MSQDPFSILSQVRTLRVSSQGCHFNPEVKSTVQEQRKPEISGKPEIRRKPHIQNSPLGKGWATGHTRDHNSEESFASPYSGGRGTLGRLFLLHSVSQKRAEEQAADRIPEEA